MLRFTRQLYRRCLIHHQFQSSLTTHKFQLHTSCSLAAMEMRDIVKRLETIAPTKHAEEWDNVGLLVEPAQTGVIDRVLLTNDLTEEVMDEVDKMPGGEKIGLIISYHPPIFRPFKRLTQKTAKERIILRAIQAGIGIYSPHTALDNEGGITKWLLSGLGEGEIISLGVTKQPPSLPNVVNVSGLDERETKLVKEIVSHSETSVGTVMHSGATSLDVQLECTDQALAVILPKLKESFKSERISVSTNTQVNAHTCGGKLLKLDEPTLLSNIVARIKDHLQLKHVRLAKPNTSELFVRTVAACCGSGGSVLCGVPASLYLTGEMSHHEVLAATSQGTAVVLCEHSNTERGYLHQCYKQLLEAALLNKVEVVVSKSDKDPLEVV